MIGLASLIATLLAMAAMVSVRSRCKGADDQRECDDEEREHAENAADSEADAVGRLDGDAVDRELRDKFSRPSR